MSRVTWLLLGSLTIGASAMTYYNVGLSDQHTTMKSVREGSYGGSIGGGFRTGK